MMGLFIQFMIIRKRNLIDKFLGDGNGQQLVLYYFKGAIIYKKDLFINEKES